jgi:lipopolysaccharide transport system ATP-binding protein
MSSSDSAVSVRDLSKAYTIAHDQEKHVTLAETMLSRLKNPLRRLKTETFWALKDVSFDIKQGDVVGIIGRNGAGKSTLLKVLSRITEPTVGEIDIYGRVGSLLEVGTGFHPELTGRENIFLNGAILGMNKSEVRNHFDEIVDFAGVEKFLDTPVKRYSSGMYVRLAFSVAAHLRSDILLVDEVLAVGDAAFQKKCLGRMGEIVGREGRTIFFVSHNMGAVRSLCRYAIWLDAGQVRMIGETASISEAYFRDSKSAGAHDLDVSKLPRPSWASQRLKIKRICLNGGMPLLHGEEFAAVIEYETESDVTGVSLGLGFSTVEGTRIMTIDSDLSGSRQSLARNRHGTVRFTVKELHLQPGDYLLDLGARSGDSHPLDYLAAFARVEILAGPATPSTIIRDGGGVRVPASWTWLP